MEIPPVVIDRLPLYTRALSALEAEGREVLGYEGFAPQGFRIVEAFDTDAARVGERFNSLTVKSADDLESVLSANPADVGIVAVPAEIAQNVINTLVKCGVRAILNYAPIAAQVPRGVHLKRIEPVLALQSMTYYLKNSRGPA